MNIELRHPQAPAPLLPAGQGGDLYGKGSDILLIPHIEIVAGQVDGGSTIISSQLEEGFGSGWLMKGLPKSVYSRINSAADNKIYELTQQGVDTSEVTPWDFISMPDCKEIAIYQKNWSSFFEQLLTRPEDASISGGKEAKTDWIIRINTVKSKLANKTYSVPFEEFTFVSSVYEWITDVLIM